MILNKFEQFSKDSKISKKNNQFSEVPIQGRATYCYSFYF